MFRTGGNFDKLLENATNHLLMGPDWSSILQICALIRQNDIEPKYALSALKRKLFSQNRHTALYALLVLESMVKNCGAPLHEELTTRDFCENLYELAKTTPHENVRQKLFELIQAWYFAFRKSPKHGALEDTMMQMKWEGFKFPTFRESDAMFSVDSAPEWVDGDVCHRCRITFSIIQRKFHCRACGQVFCGQCSQKTTTLPRFGIEKEVRVCDSCYDQATKPSAACKAAEKQENELLLEYLNGSLAQQSQVPPRKSDEEAKGARREQVKKKHEKTEEELRKHKEIASSSEKETDQEKMDQILKKLDEIINTIQEMKKDNISIKTTIEDLRGQFKEKEKKKEENNDKLIERIEGANDCE